MRSSDRPVHRQRLVDQLVLGRAEAALRESHPLGQRAEQPHVAPRLAQRRNRLLRHLREQVSIRALHILHLQKRRRRQHHVRIIRRVGKELLVHHRKQVRAHHPAQHRILVRRNRRRVRVVNKQRLHRRPICASSFRTACHPSEGALFASRGASCSLFFRPNSVSACPNRLIFTVRASRPNDSPASTPASAAHRY